MDLGGDRTHNLNSEEHQLCQLCHLALSANSFYNCPSNFQLIITNLNFKKTPNLKNIYMIMVLCIAVLCTNQFLL